MCWFDDLSPIRSRHPSALGRLEMTHKKCTEKSNSYFLISKEDYVTKHWTTGLSIVLRIFSSNYVNSLLSSFTLVSQTYPPDHRSHWPLHCHCVLGACSLIQNRILSHIFLPLSPHVHQKKSQVPSLQKKKSLPSSMELSSIVWEVNIPIWSIGLQIFFNQCRKESVTSSWLRGIQLRQESYKEAPCRIKKISPPTINFCPALKTIKSQFLEYGNSHFTSSVSYRNSAQVW